MTKKPMIETISKFCTFCGRPLTTRHTGYFDSKTGAEIYFGICLDPRCEEGKHHLCQDSGGHHWNFWGTKCKTCGKRKMVR